MSESQCCILERVARAMWFYHVDLQGYPNGCPTWDEMLLMPSEQGVVEEVRSNAKAAIRAMLDGQEPVAWRYDHPVFGSPIYKEPQELKRLGGDTQETPLYDLSALKEAVG